MKQSKTIHYPTYDKYIKNQTGTTTRVPSIFYIYMRKSILYVTTKREVNF